MASHRYRRQFDPASGNSLALLADRIPAGATVLELGPAGGHFTRHLRENLDCTVDAVELDPSMADAARAWCRTMVVGDLEALDLPALLPAAAYDVVLMADVLEHLRDPAPLLRQLHSLLKPGGRCLVSVPNVAYGGLIASLLGGEFTYRDEGLLDRTHLRFYTRGSLEQLLERAGWFPRAWQPVRLSYWESEFRTRLETLPSAIGELLAGRPELFCYQWVVEAGAEAPAQAPDVARLDAWPGERFPVRLFWADETTPFDYACSQVLWGQIGTLRKVEEFVLDDAANATRLRLRLADRPGFMRLHELVLCGADEKTLWHWTAADGVAALSAACSGMTLADAGEHALLVLNEPESWLDLAWQGAAASPARTVRLTFGWPESADFVAARAGWEAAVIPLRAELDAVKSLVGTRDRELATRDALLQAQGEQLSGQLQRLAGQDAQLQAQAQRLAARDAQLQAQEQGLQSQSWEISALRRELEQQMAQTTTLQAQITRMLTFSWWLKQPLRWLRDLL